MRYDRMIVGYHGCDAEVAEQLLAGAPFRPSENWYDWLAGGVYFWEYGPDRAWRFAEEQRRRGRLNKAAVVGALIQLGNCFDLLDTENTRRVAEEYEMLRGEHEQSGLPIPRNEGRAPEHKLRRLDCWILKRYFQRRELAGIGVDTARCCFVEGEPAFPGSGISKEAHIQIAVRNPACILGAFRPSVHPRREYLLPGL